jgi:hypothetical protein
MLYRGGDVGHQSRRDLFLATSFLDFGHTALERKLLEEDDRGQK